jgi:predicted nucleic acid-binding protein
VIVADANLVAYLLIPGPFTIEAERVLAQDPIWLAPVLWRSELASILIKHIRAGTLTMAGAEEHFAEAHDLLRDGEFSVDHVEALRLAASAGCSSYDCEYVAGALSAGVPLITFDKRLLAAFPHVAMSASQFAPL